MRTNQAFYIAEAGINRAAGWFSSRFGVDPDSGLYVLPEQYPSNTAGVEGKLSYIPTAVYYKKGSQQTSPEQAIPTSVKVLKGGNLQNVVLSGDQSNTYPADYSVQINDSFGNAKELAYKNNVVINDYANNLVNQSMGEGRFSVKATLVSINMIEGLPQGTITWLVESTGKITRGDSTIASATLSAYLSARVIPVEFDKVVEVGSEEVNSEPGLVGRGMVEWNSDKVRLDSYRSSKGAYGISLTSNSFTGQIGAYNIGSRGDMRTNNEYSGYINALNGLVTGQASATLAQPTPESPSDGHDPITIDMHKVEDGRGGLFSEANKLYGRRALIFPAVSEPIPPQSGATNYSLSKNQNSVLPPGNYNNISVSKGRLTIPPGNYGIIDVSSQGEIVMGVPGLSTTYNLQGFTSSAQSKLIFNGAVTINVKSSLDVGAQSSVADLRIPASAIRWNFKGGSTERIYLGGQGATLGVFYAPNNDLEMRGGSNFYGAITARNVDIRGNANIHIDEDAVSGARTTRAVSDRVKKVVGYTATNYSLWRITQDVN